MNLFVLPPCFCCRGNIVFQKNQRICLSFYHVFVLEKILYSNRNKCNVQDSYKSCLCLLYIYSRIYILLFAPFTLFYLPFSPPPLILFSSLLQYIFAPMDASCSCLNVWHIRVEKSLMFFSTMVLILDGSSDQIWNIRTFVFWTNILPSFQLVFVP